MPVCARCTGIYFGAAVAAIAVRVKVHTVRVEADTTYGAKMALILAVIPILATLVYEWTSGHTPANWIRAATGVPMGAAVGWIISAIG